MALQGWCSLWQKIHIFNNKNFLSAGYFEKNFEKRFAAKLISLVVCYKRLKRLIWGRRRKTIVLITVFLMWYTVLLLWNGRKWKRWLELKWEIFRQWFVDHYLSFHIASLRTTEISQMQESLQHKGKIWQSSKISSSSVWSYRNRCASLI